MSANKKIISIKITVGEKLQEGDRVMLYHPQNKNYYLLIDKKLKEKIKNRNTIRIKQYLN